MAIATAQQLRDRSQKIVVSLSDGLDVECRRPDPLDLIASGLIDLAL